nr:alpha/beta hydrolase [uncultured Flavobacterium sp.]
MTTTNKTIILITGAFVSHSIWHNWEIYFREKGFTVLVPPWPHKDAPVAELRNSLPNNPSFASMRLADVIAHYENIVTSLPEKPIVIGHSLGGLIVQILVNRGLVSAGIALHSVPPKGIFSFEWSFVKAIMKPLGLLPFGKKTYMMSRDEWDKHYANGLDAKAQAEGYNNYCIPESRQVLRDALTDMAKVDFEKPHPPLLLISGTNDLFVPLSLMYENYIKYHREHYIADYKKFEGRNHFAPALPTWKEEADYILEWLLIQGL